MIEVREPQSDQEWKDYYHLRYTILRKPLNQPIGSEKNDGDEAGQHFALYENSNLKGIGRLDSPESNISQIRFFCVDSSAQGKGFGQQLMLEIETFSQERGDSKMILQARENAVEFYSKLGYRIVKKSHLLYGQVQHFLMEKTY